MNSARNVIWLRDVDTESEHFGTHNKHSTRLLQAKFPLVPGFVITTHAYRNFLLENNLEHKIKQLLSTISFERPDSLMQAENLIKKLFQEAKISDELYEELVVFYNKIGKEVTLEIYETGKNVRIHAKKKVTTYADFADEVINLWSEMFSGNALWHRHHGKMNHFENKAEIIVKKKIRGEKAGKIFTIDPVTHAKDKLVIITTHPHDRDEYVLSKKNLTILDRKLKNTHLVDKLTLDEILAIAKLAKRLEEHIYFPQVISWILDNSLLYISEIKPFTEFAKLSTEIPRKLPIARGKGVTSIIGTGIVTRINSHTSLPNLTSHTILVVPNITPNQIKKLKKIKGLIIEDFANSESANHMRHLGIPAICNVKNATKTFRNGNVITINGAKGEIYRGGVMPTYFVSHTE